MAERARKTMSRRLGDAVDGAIAVFDPMRAGKRQQARAALEVMNTAYRGAEHSRVRDWIPSSASADADLLPELPTLRTRSRDAVRNHALARGTLTTLVANELGTGLGIQADVDGEKLGIGEEEERDLENAIDLAWEEWAQEAHFSERLTFGGMCEMVRISQFTDGDLLGVRRNVATPYSPYRLRVDLIEADRVCSPYSLPADLKAADDQAGRRREIRDGIEIGERGQELAYWVLKRHPNDFYGSTFGNSATDFTRIPARDRNGNLQVLHIYKKNRIGASRGEPELAPVLALLHDMDQYIESEMVAARVAACFAAFITTPNPWDETGGAVFDQDAYDRDVEEMYPGMVRRLLNGEKVEFGNPSRPGNPFEVFIDRTIMLFAAALGMPPQVLTQNWENMNYSSMRGALIEAWRSYRRNAMWLWESFGAPVRLWFIQELIDREFLVVRGNPTAKQLAKCRVLLPGREWVDPLKEQQADAGAILSGIQTVGDVLHKRGTTVEAHVRQEKRERRVYDAAGLEYPGDKQPANSANSNATDPQPAENRLERDAGGVAEPVEA